MSDVNELDQARETIRRLNRRVQSAEAGLAEKVNANAGRSLGRALANASATMHAAQLAEARAEIERLLHIIELRDRVIDEMRLDVDRLEWLDEGANYFLVTPATNMVGVPKGWTHRVGRPLDSVGERCLDIREAIDHARRLSR